MATITLTISNAAATRFVTAIGYQATINGVPNPITALEFAKAWIVNDIKDVVKRFESPAIIQAAVSNNSNDVDSNIIIT